MNVPDASDAPTATFDPPPNFNWGLSGSPGTQQSKPQTIWQKIKNVLCNGGNALVGEVDGLTSLSTTMEEVGGAAVVAGVIGQPEINPVADAAVLSGAATMATGGAMGMLGNVFQAVGGIGQMIGGNNASVGQANFTTGMNTVAAGAALAAIGGFASLPINSAANRAYNSMTNKAVAFAGLAGDAGAGLAPGPGQTTCGP
jgi:hypothetical protein